MCITRAKEIEKKRKSALRQPVVIDKNQKIPGTSFFKMWTIGEKGNYKAEVPIFNIHNMHGLNSFVGYVMLKNAEYGTILYRGQTQLYHGTQDAYCDLLPSICHFDRNGDNKRSAQKKRNKVVYERLISLEKRIGAILNDEDLLGQVRYNFNKLNEEQNKELKVVIESLLQHYGDKTRCMDFVDNHWIALWFGLYQWTRLSPNSSDGTPIQCFYKKRLIMKSKADQKNAESRIIELIYNDIKRVCCSRNITEAFCEINSILRRENYEISTTGDEFLYLILFAADTIGSIQHAGVYSGENMTVVDLRRALPSTFLRPGAQHGWTVKMNSTTDSSGLGKYSFCKNVVAILRIPLNLADELIGGSLLSQENLFPPKEYDQGYRILLKRQELAQEGKNHSDLDDAFASQPILDYK